MFAWSTIHKHSHTHMPEREQPEGSKYRGNELSFSFLAPFVKCQKS